MGLRVYDDAIEMVGRVHRLADHVARFDRDLARQMKRSSSSVPLNLMEGLWSRKGTRTQRLHDSMASGKETMAQVDVCVAAGYAKRPQVESLLDLIDKIVATTWKLSRRSAPCFG